MKKVFETERILQEQIGLLSENSKNGSLDELPKYSDAMANLFKSLYASRVLLFVVGANCIIDLIILIHKLFRSKR